MNRYVTEQLRKIDNEHPRIKMFKIPLLDFIRYYNETPPVSQMDYQEYGLNTIRIKGKRVECLMFRGKPVIVKV